MRARRQVLALFLLLQPPLVAAVDGSLVTRTGWFADESCAANRVKTGRTGPPGQSCTRECIAKGVPVVFIDEKTGQLFRVENPALAKGRESDHVEIRATMDPAAKTVRVESVKLLEQYAATCSAK